MVHRFMNFYYGLCSGVGPVLRVVPRVSGKRSLPESLSLRFPGLGTGSVGKLD